MYDQYGYVWVVRMRPFWDPTETVLRDRTSLPILKSTAYCIYQNSHTRPALDHNSTSLLFFFYFNLSISATARTGTHTNYTYYCMHG